MKKYYSIAFFYSLFLFSGYAQDFSIVNLPQGDYTKIVFTTEQKNELEQLSNAFTHLPKVNSILPSEPFVSYSTTDFWPEGAWGRGYETALTPSLFHSAQSGGLYFACHPLIRDASYFVRGHIQLYNSGHTQGNSRSLAEKGIDYILSQISTKRFSGRGGVLLPMFRKEQFDISSAIPQNKFNEYETAYALSAICEYYLSEFSYKRAEVLKGIQLAAQFLRKHDWEHSNSNVRGLGVWALSQVYRITKEHSLYLKIKEITSIILKDQDQSGTDWDGAWLTGGLEENMYQKEAIYHDTKIFYHFMTLRGLVEVFGISTDDDLQFKKQVMNAISKGFNHVIKYRLYSPLSNSCNLTYLYKTTNGTKVPWQEREDDNLEKYIETCMKMGYYMKNCTYYSKSDKENILNLSLKLAACLNSSNKWHITGIGYYSNYILSIETGKNPFSTKK